MIKVLFICLGNICRSPSAEGAMQMLIEERNLTDQVSCDSAGTSAYHAGQPADARMTDAANTRGIQLTSQSRQFVESDFINFDYILTMDPSNYADLKDIDYKNQYLDKVIPFTNFCNIHDITEVPDPYYGNGDGFQLVMDIVEDGCKGLLDSLIREKKVIC